MSDDGRRVFSMETVLGVIAGKDSADVLDFLGYAVNRPVCECCRTAVVPMVKGWLYSLNPAFMKAEYAEGTSFETWVHEVKAKLGYSVSVTPLPEREAASVHSVMDMLKTAKETAEEKIAEAEAAVAEVAALTPFKKKAEEFEKKAAQLEEKNKALDEQVATLKKEASAFTGKIALGANEIEQSVKDLVAKAVKDALANMPVAAAGVAAAGAAVAGVVAEAASPATADGGGDSSGPVPDTFGFGSSGSSDEGFGF